MQVKNKIFVVTGAGNGMGKELTLQLLKKGAKVAAVDIREDSLHKLKEDAGEKAEHLSTHILNISDRGAVESFPDRVIEAHGAVDAVINNAGIIQPFVKITDLNYETVDRVMYINFYGPLHMTKAFLPHLLKRPQAHIANVSSMGGFLPVPGQSVYGASKAAIKLLTEGLFAELINTKIGVTIIFPGAINTNISANSGVEPPKISKEQAEKNNFPTTSAKIAAEIMIDAIEKNKPQVFVGKDSKMMNFLYRISPVFATKMIAKQMKSLLPE